MKTAHEIEKIAEQAIQHETAAQTALAAMNQELAKLPRDGFTPEYLAGKEKEIRERHQPAIASALTAIQEIVSGLQSDVALYDDKAFLLSLEPVSKRLNGQDRAPAEDAATEALARLAKMTEYRLMPDALLHRCADAAKSAGRLGEIHLISLENNSRDTKSPGWKPIDISDVVIPEQAIAQSAYRTAKASELATEHAFRTVINSKSVTPVDRMNLARAKEA